MEKEQNVKTERTEKQAMKALVTETRNGHLLATRQPVKGKDGKIMKTRSGKDFYSYVVEGYVKGKPVKADLSGNDDGYYEIYEMMFGFSDKAELIVEDREQESQSGKVTRYKAYTLQVVDENGVVFTAPVKPQRGSDKTWIEFMLQDLPVEEE